MGWLSLDYPLILRTLRYCSNSVALCLQYGSYMFLLMYEVRCECSCLIKTLCLINEHYNKMFYKVLNVLQGDLLIEVDHVIEFIIKLLSENGHKLECLNIETSGKYVTVLCGGNHDYIMFITQAHS